MSDAPSRDDVAQTLHLDPTSTKTRQTWRWLTLGILACAVLGTGWYMFGTHQDKNATQYATASATRGDLDITVTATGTLEPINEIEVSSELSGIVRKVLVDYNDPVHQGQTLAELNTDLLEAEVARARAGLSAAKANVQQGKATLAEAQRDYDRYKKLFAKDATSEQTYDKVKAVKARAVAALASVEADVAVTEADLKLKETNLKKACICSPIDGVVLKRNVDPGQTVASSFQAPVLFTIAGDFTSMDLQVDVDEADVGLVAKGQTAQFTVDAYSERSFPATVTKVRFAPEEIEGVVTYKTQLMVDNRDLLLRPGMTATAEISVSTIKDALLVPNEALRFTPPAPKSETSSGGGLFGKLIPRPPSSNAVRENSDAKHKTVWVLDGGVPTAIPVTVGLSDGKKTEIKAGALTAGQEVLLSIRDAGT